MDENIAGQIADLLNAQNQLAVTYDASRVLAAAERYLYHLDVNSKVLGAVEVKKVQWYQCEIDHLTVDPGARRRGLAEELVREAEARAREFGASIAQATIRVGNTAGERLFVKCGFIATVTFLNATTGRRVAVYQKVLSER